MEITATRKKFEIINRDPPYQPRERRLPRFRVIEELSSARETDGGGSHRLYLTSEAMNHIRRHIGWGEATPRNRVEQGGILLGQAFRDSERGVTYGIVGAAVAGLSARGSNAHLEMTHDTWKEMLDSAERLAEQSPHEELNVIGWYHTHPNSLDVFMSGTDRHTQSRMFSHDWQFAIVLNPHRPRWRAFFGGEAHECGGFVIARDEDAPGDRPAASAAAPHERPDDADEGSAKRDAPGRRARLFERLNSLTERLSALADNPRSLLRACLAALLLVLLLQCVAVGIQVIILLLRR